MAKFAREGGEVPVGVSTVDEFHAMDTDITAYFLCGITDEQAKSLGITIDGVPFKQGITNYEIAELKKKSESKI